MNAPIDTLAFARRFEDAGFGHEQARVLAVTFSEASDSVREGLITKDYLDLRLAEFEGRINKQFNDLELRFTRQSSDSEARISKQSADPETKLAKQFGDLEVRLTRHVGEVGKEVTGRLWSPVAIIAGVSTAISATIGAGITLLLRSGAL